MDKIKNSGSGVGYGSGFERGHSYSDIRVIHRMPDNLRTMLEPIYLSGIQIKNCSKGRFTPIEMQVVVVKVK